MCIYLQVPEAVLDKRSTAYNKGKVFIHGSNENTANAYKKQFQADLASFLRSRSKEMKRGGSMFLVCLGRTSIDPTDQGGAGLLFGTHFQDAWNDLVQEVYITKYYYICFYKFSSFCVNSVVNHKYPQIFFLVFFLTCKTKKYHSKDDMIICCCWSS